MAPTPDMRPDPSCSGLLSLSPSLSHEAPVTEMRTLKIRGGNLLVNRTSSTDGRHVAETPCFELLLLSKVPSHSKPLCPPVAGIVLIDSPSIVIFRSSTLFLECRARKHCIYIAADAKRACHLHPHARREGSGAGWLKTSPAGRRSIEVFSFILGPATWPIVVVSMVLPAGFVFRHKYLPAGHIKADFLV